MLTRVRRRRGLLWPVVLLLDEDLSAIQSSIRTADGRSRLAGLFHPASEPGREQPLLELARASRWTSPGGRGRLSFKLRAPRPQASSSRRARTTRSASRRSLRPGKMASCSLRAASMSKSTRAPSNTRAPASNPRPHAVEIRTTIATTSTTRVTPPPVAAHPRSGSRCSSRSGRSLRKWTL